MSNIDYTIQDEKNKLERFLKKENIEVNHNYLRMEKGPKPLLYRVITFSHQLRFKSLKQYFLIFTADYLILLFQDEEYKFTTNNMVKINHNDIHNFSFQRKYGDYCIFFTHSNEDYNFYLNDRLSSRILDKVFNLKKLNYSYENLAFLKENNFMGLL